MRSLNQTPRKRAEQLTRDTADTLAKIDIKDVYRCYPSRTKCLWHLEDLRWGHLTYCPHCDSEEVAPKTETGRVGRWNCHGCTSSFNVLSGTVMCKTRLPLQVWFYAIWIIYDSSDMPSTSGLASRLGVSRQTALSLAKRIGAAVERHDELLNRIFEHLQRRSRRSRFSGFYDDYEDCEDWWPHRRQGPD